MKKDRFVPRALWAYIVTLVLSLPLNAQNKFHAFLIGLNSTQETKLRQLKHACDDVDALERTLDDLGYEVIVMKDVKADRRQIIVQLNTYAATLQETDKLLLYFSGHGIKSDLNKDTYWMTHDAKIDNLDVDGIRLKYLLDYIQDIKAGVKIVLLDHCYSGTLVKTATQATLDGTPRGGAGNDTLIRGSLPTDILKKDIENRQGLIILAASTAEALELPDLGHGVFTYVLLKALTSKVADSNNSGKLEVAELQDYLSREVPIVAQAHQFEQKVADFTVASGLPDIVLVSNLPAGTDQEATKQRKAFIDKLNELWDKEFITSETVAFCTELINKHYSASATGTTLSEEEKRRYSKITLLLTNAGASSIEGTSIPAASEEREGQLLENYVISIRQ